MPRKRAERVAAKRLSFTVPAELYWKFRQTAVEHRLRPRQAFQMAVKEWIELQETQDNVARNMGIIRSILTGDRRRDGRVIMMPAGDPAS